MLAGRLVAGRLIWKLLGPSYQDSLRFFRIGAVSCALTRVLPMDILQLEGRGADHTTYKDPQ